MPCIFEGDGFKVYIHYADHNPPHFHVHSGGSRATFLISTGRLQTGRLPRRLSREVSQWAAQHRRELQKCWDRAARNEPTGTVD